MHVQKDFFWPTKAGFFYVVFFLKKRVNKSRRKFKHCLGAHRDAVVIRVKGVDLRLKMPRSDDLLGKGKLLLITTSVKVPRRGERLFETVVQS